MKGRNAGGWGKGKICRFEVEARIDWGVLRAECHFVIGRALLIWLLITGLEIIQGILRVRYLNRPLGDHRARQVGVDAGR